MAGAGKTDESRRRDPAEREREGAEEEGAGAACFDCPRACAVSRDRGRGFCGKDGRLRVASVCLHRGEEPPISGRRGAVNVFFVGCNLRCRFCQNFQISRREHRDDWPEWRLEDLVERIAVLAAQGGHCVNLVSPSHLPHTSRRLIAALRKRGLDLPVVMNTNGYDALGALRLLEGRVDVWLPDLKYGDPALAKRLSGAADYVEVATAALREMARQTGAELETDAAGLARRGMIVRHLVLPGQPGNTRRALRLLRDTLGVGTPLSLMAQYRPPDGVAQEGALGGRLHASEYESACEYAIELGFEEGWFQEPDSPDHYHPDFRQPHPFEDGPG